jgi:rubredoxin
MKFSSSALATLVITEAQIAGAFTIPSPSFSRNAVSLKASSEFDFILQEGVHVENALIQKTTKKGIDTNYIIGVPDSSAAATLTSSVTFEEASGMASDMDAEGENGEGSSFNYLSDDIQEGETDNSDPRVAEILRKEKQQMAMKSQPADKTPLSVKTLNYLKGKDFGEIFFTVLVPVIGGYYFLKKAYEKVSDQVETKADDTLDAYANEMIYHNGDFEEMKLAHLDYGKKLMFLGPKKNDAMLKRYLEFYAKKVTVSPQAISALSYVFSLYKLTEDRAAEVLCELCMSMPEKVASAGKLLFFGNHILKSKEAKAKLKPIKDLLSSSYRDDGVISGEEIVEKSQIEMGKAAYRATVAAAGKGQTKLTVGWEVLGLDKDTATAIFDEVAKEGFLTKTQAKYGAKQQKYDDKGRKIDDSGKMENPEEADEDKGDDDMTPSGNVQECTECGFTLFVAEGRDFKFFNAGFTCPECGASKDKFKPVTMD